MAIKKQLQDVVFLSNKNHLKSFYFNSSFPSAIGLLGFVLYSGLKIQGLFKDIPGRNSNFQALHLVKNAIRM